LAAQLTIRDGWPPIESSPPRGPAVAACRLLQAREVGAWDVRLGAAALGRQFEVKMAIVALGASATAIAVSRSILGDSPDFSVGALSYASAEIRPLYFVLGAVAGLVAVAYNRVLLSTIGAADRLSSWPVELRAGLIGAGVGTLAWFAPGLVGGSDTITQSALAGAGTLTAIPAVFLLRFGLGALSYAARTPGGLFAPLLVLGAQLGLSFGIICGLAFPASHIQPEGFAIVGMAALFTGIVRAPLTGLVLVTEMTASVTMLLPMLGACYVAMLVPTLLRDPPIYDSLRETHDNSTSRD
jgi:CIC family chloride channel protein